jgi:hypothetical protein
VLQWDGGTGARIVRAAAKAALIFGASETKLSLI